MCRNSNIFERIEMIAPPYIQPGDRIRIVAPAGKIKKERILPAIEWLKNKGFELKVGKHVFSGHYQYAGTDAQRLQDVQEALDDNKCRAIICARGGYGTVRIIGSLDFSAFVKHPKWVVGYSDITALHLALNNLGFETIHGTMPPFFFNENGQANENLTSLLRVISGEDVSYQFKAKGAHRTGSASGELIGGNLTIITSLLATEYEIQTKGKILFIEDIDEYLYHIDRMMYQLKLSGKLEHLAGLVVGDFTDMKDNDDPFGQNVQEIIWEAVKEYRYPVAFGLKAGHDTVNLALSFGTKCELDVTDDLSTLTLEHETLN